MNSAKRIFVNTLAQHLRSVFNICLSLFSTRLVLQALGQSDFGIYSLVAGVVALLSFLTNAMVVTTQRQLSFCHGKGSMADVRRMFSNSLMLHWLLGLALSALLIAIVPLLFDGFLKIDPSRMATATTVYYLVVLTLFITFLTAPYRALFIARENIVFISIVDILDGVLKLLAALWLLHCPFDRLIAYAGIVACIMAFNLLAFATWAQTHFEESLLLPKSRYINCSQIKELTNFAGWTVYSQLCITGRSQGMAIVFNRFFGTTLNAAYGIAQQVLGAIYFVALSVTNAMSPQLVKAEGSGDRRRMLRLSELLSKYAFLLLSMVVIPLVFEAPAILSYWLQDVPPHSVLLCRAVLLTAVIDQLTTGLGVANQAIGRIRNYSIVINSIKLLTIPMCCICLSLGCSITSAMWCFVLTEAVGMICRIPFLRVTAGLDVRHFVKEVFVRVVPPLLVMVLSCWLIVTYVHIPLRFVLTFVVSVGLAVITSYFFSVNDSERQTFVNIIKRRE